MDSNGKVAVITGAGSGIGRSSALLLLKDGYSVALAGRREDPLKETIELAGDDGSRGIAVSTDVGDPKSIGNLFDQVKNTFGRLDVLFNNKQYVYILFGILYCVLCIMLLLLLYILLYYIILYYII